jgi:hypothetical protein
MFGLKKRNDLPGSVCYENNVVRFIKIGGNSDWTETRYVFVPFVRAGKLVRWLSFPLNEFGFAPRRGLKCGRRRLGFTGSFVKPRTRWTFRMVGRFYLAGNVPECVQQAIATYVQRRENRLWEKAMRENPELFSSCDGSEEYLTRKKR